MSDAKQQPESPPPIPPSPGYYGIETKDFLERALPAASEWTRHADPKILGVLVLLGLGSKDLIDHSGRLLAPHEPKASSCDLIGVTGHTCGGLVATSAWIGAALLAALVVVLVSHALFPRLKMRGLLTGDHEQGPITSRFYFGEVARYKSQDTYRTAVKAKKPHELLDDLAGQVYEISRIANDKHLATKRAYVLVLAFLAMWAIARVSLATT